MVQISFTVLVPPTSKDQCEHGGWRNFDNRLPNQGDGVSFVQTGKS